MIQFLFLFQDWALLLLRIVIAVVLFSHGWPKLRDLKGTGKAFDKMGFRPPIFWGAVVAALETVGALAIAFGFLTQLVALLVVVEFIVALLTVKRKVSVVSGKELDLLILVSALMLATSGGGVYSIDHVLNLFLY